MRGRAAERRLADALFLDHRDSGRRIRDLPAAQVLDDVLRLVKKLHDASVADRSILTCFDPQVLDQVVRGWPQGRVLASLDHREPGGERLGVWVINEADELDHWMKMPIRQIATDRPDLALAARKAAAT